VVAMSHIRHSPLQLLHLHQVCRLVLEQSLTLAMSLNRKAVHPQANLAVVAKRLRKLVKRKREKEGLTYWEQ
jgi:hypothetical protein